MSKISSFVFALVVLLWCSKVSFGQVQLEPVKIPLCHRSYEFTSFSAPNIRNDTSQDAAIRRLHKFAPLIATFCHRNIVLFLCLVHIPAYTQEPDAPVELRPPCRSLCQNVTTSCQYAIDKLNFFWPDEISCRKFNNANCFAETDDSRYEQLPSAPPGCSSVAYHGGTPICSSVLSATPNTQYFVNVTDPFSNYFNHTTQEQAITELSQHGRLIHLLISQQPDTDTINTVTLCLNNIRFLLCNLYLPRCGITNPEQYPFTRTQCKTIIENNCASTITELRNRGYRITWPPVDVNCDDFSNNRPARNPEFKRDRTFGDLSAPPPALDIDNIGEDFLQIKWDNLPEEFKLGLTVQTALLYREAASRVPYNNSLYTTETNATLPGLKVNTSYEILLGSVNNVSMYPGTFSKIKVSTSPKTEQIASSFCSTLYPLTLLPNIFGHKTQNESFLAMHTFAPLLRTGCSSDMRALMCSAYLPSYLVKERVSQPPCRSLCQSVFVKCAYAISELNFKWPEELKCDNLPQEQSCYPASSSPLPLESDICERVKEQSICSFVTNPDKSGPFVTSVEKKFKNYFNHTSQEQAVYELGKHSKLLSLLSAQTNLGPVAQRVQCIQQLSYFLCSLYLPNCRAGVQLSRDDCRSVIGDDTTGQTSVCSPSLPTLQPYNIEWPPVNVDCNTINSSVATPPHNFSAIQFQNIVPPPPRIVYRTLSNAVELRWNNGFLAVLHLSGARGLTFLFKPRNSKVTFTHRQLPDFQNERISLNINTDKDYDIFVASLDIKSRMPGHFERITYTAGSSVIPITNSNGPCRQLYDQTVLPNSFGDKNISTAKSRMYVYFPLVHTLCSESLPQLLCSVFLPRYNSGTQLPCRSTCMTILNSCSYAITRSKFFWPPELQCQSEIFDDKDKCLDVTVSRNRNPRIGPEDVGAPQKRAAPECKATTTSVCLSVMKRGENNRLVSRFATTFTEGRPEGVNYFGHGSTDEAIYELSQHLRLLSSLTNLRNEERDLCLRNIIPLLCHLHLPVCPLELFPRETCIDTLSNSTACFSAVTLLNDQGFDLPWPPIQVDCMNNIWFKDNITIDNGPTDELTDELYTFPPPRNIRISRTTTEEISVSFTPLASTSPFPFTSPKTALLFRENDTRTTYSLALPQIQQNQFNLKNLSLAKGYEIKVATLGITAEFPGPFRTITARTLDMNVVDIPSAVDICYEFYRQTTLPNMYGDKNIDEAKLRFFPFYPLVYTSCSPELTTFMCSVFLPRYDPVTYSSQRPCRHACARVFQSCQYAIGQSKFFWPLELTCDNFKDDKACYDLSKTVPDLKGDSGSALNPEDIPEAEVPQRRRKRRGDEEAECHPTPTTLICSQVSDQDGVKGGRDESIPYFKQTFTKGNYFNHDSTDVAIYELSKYTNLLSWLEADPDKSCFGDLAFLLCHLHLPNCKGNGRISQTACERASVRGSACFDAITRLNNNGLNFTWPPVNVDCTDEKWFNNATRFDNYFIRQNSAIGPPAPSRIRVTRKTDLALRLSFRATAPYNSTVLYRRKGITTPYKYLKPPVDSPVNIRNLMPATDYEIYFASLQLKSGFPGAFNSITANTIGQCPNDTTGEDVAQGRFTWPAVSGGIVHQTSCPYGKNEITSSQSDGPYRLCACDSDDVCKKPSWDEPSVKECNFFEINDSDVTSTLSGVLQMLTGDDVSVLNASEQLANITGISASEFDVDDVVLSTLILEDIVGDVDNLNKTGPNLVKTVNNLLKSNAQVVADSQRESNASARLITVLESYLKNVPLNLGQNVSQNEPNIAVYAQEFSSQNFNGAGVASVKETTDSLLVYDNYKELQPNVSQVSLAMPSSLFENLDIDAKSQNQRILFGIYRSTSLFTTLSKNDSKFKPGTVRKTNSFVISGSVKDQRLEDLKDPIVTTFKPLEKGIDETTACVFWNFTLLSDGSGDWSPIGCSYQGITNGVVTCHCTHLTNFAILMDVYIDERNEDHEKALSIISYVGCAISLVGLILTIITILIFKDLRSKVPTQILLNFCIALSLTLIVFLAGAERSKTSSLAGCRAAAIALHYFVLAMFVWTTVQAYNMYLAFVRVMPTYHAKFILKCCAVGWGVPAVVVIISAAAAIDEYGGDHFCRVQGLPFQVGFLAPVILILLCNSIAFALIIRSLLTSGSRVSADKRATGLQHARRGTAILVVLGLTWMFGILAIRDAKLVFQYLFCIFNSLQGLLVFIFYCVLSSETKAKYRKLLFGKSKKRAAGKLESSSEGRFHEVNYTKSKSDVYTTTTGGSSGVSSPNHQTSKL